MMIAGEFNYEFISQLIGLRLDREAGHVRGQTLSAHTWCRDAARSDRVHSLRGQHATRDVREVRIEHLAVGIGVGLHVLVDLLLCGGVGHGRGYVRIVLCLGLLCLLLVHEGDLLLLNLLDRQLIEVAGGSAAAEGGGSDVEVLLRHREDRPVKHEVMHVITAIEDVLQERAEVAVVRALIELETLDVTEESAELCGIATGKILNLGGDFALRDLLILLTLRVGLKTLPW